MSYECRARYGPLFPTSDRAQRICFPEGGTESPVTSPVSDNFVILSPAVWKTSQRVSSPFWCAPLKAISLPPGIKAIPVCPWISFGNTIRRTTDPSGWHQTSFDCSPSTADATKELESLRHANGV